MRFPLNFTGDTGDSGDNESNLLKAQKLKSHVFVPGCISLSGDCGDIVRAVVPGVPAIQMCAGTSASGNAAPENQHLTSIVPAVPA